MNLELLSRVKVDGPNRDANLESIVESFRYELAQARLGITERAALIVRDLLWAVWYYAPPGTTVEAVGMGASCSLKVCGEKVCAISPSVFDGKPFATAYYGISRERAPEVLRGVGNEELGRLNAGIKGYFDLQLQLGAAGLTDPEFRCSYEPRGASAPRHSLAPD